MSTYKRARAQSVPNMSVQYQAVVDSTGQTINVNHLKRVRSGHAARLTSLINTSKTYMQAHRPKDTVSELADKITEALKSVYHANERYAQSVAFDSKLQHVADVWFDEKRDEARETLVAITNFLARTSSKAPSTTSRNTSETKRTTRSKYSNKAELTLKLEQANLKVVHARQEADIAEQLVKLQSSQVAQKLNHTAEMAELEARLIQETLNRAESNLSQTQHGSVGRDDPVTEWVNNLPADHAEGPSINHPISSPAHSPIDEWIDDLVPGHEVDVQHDSGAVADQLTRTLIKLESERDLPQVDLPRFNGSALAWPHFIERFHAQVHCRPGLTNTRKMDLLQSHLDGEAKLLVHGLGYSGRNYALVLQELKHSFGHRIKIAKAFLDKVTSGQDITSNDPNALRRFYVSLRDCIATLQQLNYTSYLNSCDVILKVARRLPTDKTGKWNEFVRQILRTREPTLYDLRDWLRDRIDSDFNPYAVSKTFTHKKTASDRNSEKKSTMYSTSHMVETIPVSSSRNANTSSTNTSPSTNTSRSTNASPSRNTTPNADGGSYQPKQPCTLCSEAHYLYRCPLFSNKTVDERRKIISDKNLCLNCLKPNHRTETCYSSIRCREVDCGQKHHTLLHKLPLNTVRATNRKIYSPRNTVYFQIVPIFVYGQNGRALKTFAILDSGSDITLIHDDLAKDLGLNGVQQSLMVTTLNHVSKQDSARVSLNIKATDDLNARAIHVREAWTVASEAFSCQSQHLDPEWKHISHLDIPNIDASQIQMLIGLDIPEAHLQTEVIAGHENQPFAVRTILGWSLMGVAANDGHGEDVQAHVNLTISRDELLHEQVQKFWETESFGTKYENKQPLSVEDSKAQVLLEDTTRLVDGHYEVGMLWRDKDSILPNNVGSAQKRFRLMAKRLIRDNDFRIKYSASMNGYISSGQARKLRQEEIESVSPRTWYIPHHGVQNPNKPGKVRVVFDAAASYADTSLNDCLMTGPDMVNSLFGVLQRFRLYPIALSADIEGMYHQVKVPDNDSDSLRFLWKEDLHKPGPPDVYKMKVHIFGAADSSSCANYAVKRTALDNADKFDSSVVQTVLKDFYVDDLLKSVESQSAAAQLTHDLPRLLQMGGFHIHKWIANSAETLNTIPESERAIQTEDLDFDASPIQRALGLKWNISEDCFVFNPQIGNVPQTKRGVVSAVSSIFDPCGYLAPYTLRAKCIIQELWRRNLDWDDPLPTDIQLKWNAWLLELDDLINFKLPRHHATFSSSASQVEIHVFADASEAGFGAVAYLRYTTDCVTNMCSFLAAKTHVAPIKIVLTIPRLELQGAVLAVRLWNTLKHELVLPIQRVVFWTDSNTVLQYLNNEVRRFKPFVSNRVSEILESSDRKQWRHVPTSENPADYCTRGLPAKMITVPHPWLKGPDFLLNDEDEWPSLRHEEPKRSLEDDPELKLKLVMNLKTTSVRSDEITEQDPHLSKLMNPEDFSSFRRLCRRTAWILRAKHNFLSALKKHKRITSVEVSSSEYQAAVTCWVQEAQQCAFPAEIASLRRGSELPTNSRLLPLSPLFYDQLLRVGGRLHKARIPSEAKHQIILPDHNPVSRLILEEHHLKTVHGGPERVIAEVRQTFWPLCARRQAKRAIDKCLDCRRLRSRPSVPKMADLPTCRVSGVDGAFAHTGVDYFGPLQVKSGRRTVKRWGCLFTCLSTRAVHIELADSLETDDFILVLRNFIGRRGHPKHLYSDNGTNFHGANNELLQCLQNLNQSSLSAFCVPQGIDWHFNPPLSPHFGGAWERLVRSIKIALAATLKNSCVTESVLRTALIEVEAVLNNRPITYNSSSPDDFTALTPNHFLLGKPNTSQPLDVPSNCELDSRKRWRRSQAIADHVDRRWRREYLSGLTVRQRWTKNSPNISVGDLVIIVDHTKPRGHWELGRICEIFPGSDGRVRTVQVRTPRGVYIRPSVKICVLEEQIATT